MAELKAEGKYATRDQKLWLAEFEAAGAECYIWRPSDWKQVEAALR